MKKDIASLPLSIGCCEWISLPGIKVPAIEAKIVTDAKLSLLKIFESSTFKEGDDLMISFGLHPVQDNKDIEVYAVEPVRNRKLIRLENGQRLWCYSIETPVCIGSIKKNMELFLVEDLSGDFNIQLAARAIKKQIEVNPHESHLTSQPFYLGMATEAGN